MRAHAAARPRPPWPPSTAPSSRSGVEELERDICFILGLLAIKVEHQAAICEAGALPTLVSMIRRYAAKNDVHLTGVPAQTCRRTSDAITNLAHENNSIKNKVRVGLGLAAWRSGVGRLARQRGGRIMQAPRSDHGSWHMPLAPLPVHALICVALPLLQVRQEGGIPPLVTLLHSVDPKVRLAAALVAGGSSSQHAMCGPDEPGAAAIEWNLAPSLAQPQNSPLPSCPPPHRSSERWRAACARWPLRTRRTKTSSWTWAACRCSYRCCAPMTPPSTTRRAAGRDRTGWGGMWQGWAGTRHASACTLQPCSSMADSVLVRPASRTLG